MYLKSLIIKNYGPINDAEIKANFDEDGSPHPIILIGKNGSGKTLSISHILQALLLYKDEEYDAIPEKNHEQLYKILSSSYINVGNKHGSIQVNFTGKENYYLEVLSKNPEEAINKKIYPDYTDILSNDDRFKKNGLFCKKSGKIPYSDYVYLYFPVDRYYTPGWINKEIEFELHPEDQIIGRTQRNIICKTIQGKIEDYILNTIIDQQIYDKKYYIKSENGSFIVDANGSPQYVYRGKNNSIIEFLNFIISKFNNLKYNKIRLYVSPKKNRKIGILGESEDGSNDEIIDSLNKLSTGEYSLLSIFMAILMDYEKTLTVDSAFNFQDIKGIVIIDEVELNLHVELQTKVLPELIKKFKNIQFIITTQSPFFVYGIKELLQDKCEIYDMPSCVKMHNISELNEVKKAYDTFIEYNHDLHKLIEKTKLKISQAKNNDLVVITEGKTDVMYLKKAQQKLQQYCNLKIEYIGLGTPEANKYRPSGAGALDGLAEALSIVDHDIPIILLYDSDIKVKGVSGNNYVQYTDNIFKVIIPKPTFRMSENVCIEHYFKDEELKRVDSIGRRMFLGNEFNIDGISLDKKFKTEASNKCGEYSNSILDGSGNSKVYSIEDQDCGVNLALSKKDFAKNIQNDVKNFNDFDFSEFENIFRIFDEIKDKSKTKTENNMV